ncbi:RNA-BINDING ASCH DOMAIN PROTEIN [Salix viminalis]|uniref:RNA-BINDING ASCH DOMAIN PROTEIN n=1 Tax=Salix viminalis TaxID=40686 RepID=A0A9Q0NXJ3_SALVM|nr:RNA-BINDING ASCH DOMAIN PROTEIN [Salix viminalis]
MEQPTSPGTSPVELKDCIEELVKFTLESHINQNLGFNLGLSREFCSYLLKEDQNEHQPISHTTAATDCSRQVLSQPLYKRLAEALFESIIRGTLCATNKKAWTDDDNGLKQRSEWNELVLNEGTELVNIFKTVNFELHVQEPFFTQLKDGRKTVEGRCAVGAYNRIGSGASILLNKCVLLQVQEVRRYASFSEMLEAEVLAKVLPGVNTIDEGVRVYRKFYTEEKERSNGVLAICVAKSAAQPYISVARILSGLSKGGLECLLGLPQLPRTF